jgi:DNA replication and repair protein RecF
MQIKTLKLENWRNHTSFDFDFNGTTILVGSNASGKTNFLEAIYYLACGRSFRSKDNFLISWDRDFARVSGAISKKEKDKELLVVLEKGNRVAKTVKIKGQKKPTSHLLGELTCVLFTPEEIELISTLPEARRRYLNLIISQMDRHYAYNLTHYKRSMEHRNSLLRRINQGFARAEELEVWDGKIAEYGTFLMEKRLAFIRSINQTISQHYQNLSGNQESLKIDYLSSVGPEKGWAEFVTKLLANREKDIVCGVTTIGPHRDDMEFVLNNKNVVEFASRGEFRTVVLAMKLAELDYFEKETGERPVLLLDDVFSELDLSRRDLLSQIFTNQQTIVTTTDLDHVSPNVLEKAKVVEIDG